MRSWLGCDLSHPWQYAPGSTLSTCLLWALRPRATPKRGNWRPKKLYGVTQCPMAVQGFGPPWLSRGGQQRGCCSRNLYNECQAGCSMAEILAQTWARRPGQIADKPHHTGVHSSATEKRGSYIPLSLTILQDLRGAWSDDLQTLDTERLDIIEVSAVQATRQKHMQRKSLTIWPQGDQRQDSQQHTDENDSRPRSMKKWRGRGGGAPAASLSEIFVLYPFYRVWRRLEQDYKVVTWEHGEKIGHAWQRLECCRCLITSTP